MKRPHKKRVPKYHDETIYGWKFQIGYNQALDNMNNYLPTVEEITQEIINFQKNALANNSEPFNINDIKTTVVYNLAKAISKRIRQ